MGKPPEETRVQPVEVTCPGCFHTRTWEAAAACPICKYRPQADRSGALLPVGTQLRRYVVGEKLGQGGFGITYRGFDLKLHMKVAVKEYYPSDLVGRSSKDRKTVVLNVREREDVFSYGLKTFIKEARTLAQISHPHLVRVLNYFEMNETAYLVMDYLEGQELTTYLKRQPNGRLPWRQAIKLMLPVLDGLQEVHEVGFMHRDLKPGNFFLTGRNRLILLDFGAARQVSSDHASSLLIYSDGYAPYEQYLKDYLTRQGPWTDVYGAAATLYFMLTAQRPPSSLDRKQNTLLRKPDLLKPARLFVPDLPPIFDSVVLNRALAIEPEQRPRSMAQFKQQLEAVLAAEERRAAETLSTPAIDPVPSPKPAMEIGPPARPSMEPRRPAKPSPEKRPTRPSTENRLTGLNLRAVVFAVAVPALAWGGWWVWFKPLAESPKPSVVVRPATATPPAPIQPPVAATPPAPIQPPVAATPPAPTQPPVATTPSAPAVAESAPPAAAPAVPARSSLEPEMVRIPGGCFQMGSPESETGRDSDERQHRVCVEAFEIGQREVTVGEFRRFVDASSYKTDAEKSAAGKEGCWAWYSRDDEWDWRAGLSWRKPGYKQKDNYPVVCVSWNDANRYAEWLTQQTGQAYRLPSEAEWEYAARAGTTTARYWGDNPNQACRYANVTDQTKSSTGNIWDVKHECSDGYWYPAPVGSYQPNAWKLYDILGNVREWTCSAYAEDYNGSESKCSKKDTIGPLAVRGGAWGYLHPAWVRSAFRGRVDPSYRLNFQGFRLARSL